MNQATNVWYLPFILLLIGCREPTQMAAPSEPAAQARPTVPPHNQHTPLADNRASPEGDGHAARYGGQQRELRGMHVEGLFQADGVMFYLTDADNNPLPPDGVTGKAIISSGGRVMTATLVPKGESLFAAGSLESGDPASAVLTLTRSRQTQSVSFETAAVGTAFHDHVSLHGGQVGMWGHYHVELLAKDNAYSVWVTDASRSPVTSGISGVVVDSGQRLALAANPGTGSLSVKGEGAGGRPVTVEIAVADQKISLPFQASRTTGDAHAEHAH